ncbi:hypothetical protein HMPREF0682_0353 [Propionibacterium acidifaciens F0233]|uniref:Uncharacterized protein n=1 Tax=Propionibacterium acidifaciens F0233 TaxID=553198 RepID=U2S4D9_9ACTN|nr:hypothetical protein HMPREF0682_0353 [Propionibacterium acidifaciens F0233]
MTVSVGFLQKQSETDFHLSRALNYLESLSYYYLTLTYLALPEAAERAAVPPI